jgi:hypothetical protein
MYVLRRANEKMRVARAGFEMVVQVDKVVQVGKAVSK